MKKHAILLILIALFISANAFAMGSSGDRITFHPIEHATMVIKTDAVTIYVDPVGDAKLFDQYPGPDIILVTDIHGDHLAPDIVNSLKQDKTAVIGPQAVISKLSFGEILRNGEKKESNGINIEAIPMYNLTKERLNFHPKGRGNGYVLTINQKRIYLSGDTEDIREMRALKNIDYAFVCMNLPYTMTEEQAASAVLEFKPKVVFPYHYRGKGMFSDIDKFKELVSKDDEIEVRLMQWYKK